MSASLVVLTATELSDLVKSAVAEGLAQAGVVASDETLSLRDCGVSVRTLRTAIKRGELPASKAGREYRIRRSDLDSWLAQKTVSPTQPVSHDNASGSAADRAIARAMTGVA